jgi:hypothetical protein
MSGMGQAAKGQQQVGVRLDSKMLGEIGEIAEMLSTPYVKATTADVIRAVLREGIPVLRTKLAGARDPARDPACDPACDPALKEPQAG